MKGDVCFTVAGVCQLPAAPAGGGWREELACGGQNMLLFCRMFSLMKMGHAPLEQVISWESLEKTTLDWKVRRYNRGKEQQSRIRAQHHTEETRHTKNKSTRQSDCYRERSSSDAPGGWLKTDLRAEEKETILKHIQHEPEKEEILEPVKDGQGVLRCSHWLHCQCHPELVLWLLKWQF